MGRIGFITNKNGKLTGYNTQSGGGILKTIEKATDITNKKMVIVGAGNITKALLYKISTYSKKPREVEIYNRTVEKAEKLKSDFNFVKKVGSLDAFSTAEGDLLINLSRMGGSEPDSLFNEELVNRFNSVVDVTFETENTNLINLAKKLEKKYATGWDMFTFQGQIVLETILETPIDANILRKHVVNGLSEVIK